MEEAEWFHSATQIRGRPEELEEESEDELDQAWTLPWRREVTCLALIIRRTHVHLSSL